MEPKLPPALQRKAERISREIALEMSRKGRKLTKAEFVDMLARRLQVICIKVEPEA